MQRKAGRFYPTRLALNITQKRATVAITDSEEENQQDKCNIIVETNYRVRKTAIYQKIPVLTKSCSIFRQVYAYTDSSLQVALLGLFTEMLYRFPNLVVGVMTRDSVRQAFRGGITAEQIISYLEQHAHPNVRTNTHKKKSSINPCKEVKTIKLLYIILIFFGLPDAYTRHLHQLKIAAATNSRRSDKTVGE